MKANYKTRVIWSDDWQKFTVERKRKWWSKWEFCCSFYASDSTYERAKTNALDRAKSLAGDIVVGEFK